MWIDTHCHLDASEFDADRAAVASAARDAQVSRIVIPAIARFNFSAVRELAHCVNGGAYALGIHPLYAPATQDEDLAVLRSEIHASLDDPRFVGIGEIGLDFFVPGLDAVRQREIYTAQLKMARDFDLPVICHVRKSQDSVIAELRRFNVVRGIVHAFNGSFQQADAYIAQGFKLGFGGNVTFERARRIRQLAAQLPLDVLVMETDAPDIAPEWINKRRNTPDQVPRIAAVIAAMRSLTLPQLALCTTANAHAALPRLALAQR
ncbi:TatD family hydrolase [Mycetohabitans endofungorum]|uniref:TatD family hydrolase n=1 Tax=Mycetohabitans endofungorum TaxID=417203 RepID=UPI002B060134|nr:TatD family hydrolase [Mycetohabitans endofungorum]